MTKEKYMALADFQSLWTDTIKPYIALTFIAVTAVSQGATAKLVLQDGTLLDQGTFVLASEKGANSGVATLGADGKVPSSQLPAYVDDVIDLLAMTDTAPATCAKGDHYYNTSSKKIFEATAADTWAETGTDPEDGKIYINLADMKTYRWSGTVMAEISASLALGETQGTAYEGSKGKANADAIAAHTSNTDVHVTTQNKSDWNAKYDKPSGGIPSTDMSSAVQTSLGKADTALQAADITGKADKLGEAFDATKPYAVGNIVIQSSKIYECTTAVETAGAWDTVKDNFKDITDEVLTLGADGAYKPSGKKTSDFATSTQGGKADSAIQGVKVNGTLLTPDANKVVDVEVPERVTSEDLSTFVV